MMKNGFTSIVMYTAVASAMMMVLLFSSTCNGVDIVTFDESATTSSSTTWNWRSLNDPVMGGLSESTFVIKNNIAVFDGHVKIVPKLDAPGFCLVQTTDGEGGLIPKEGIDAAGTTHVLLEVRSNVAYTGFKISIAADTDEPQFNSYKASMDIPTTTTTIDDDDDDDESWTTIQIPFSSFSNKWSKFTGDAVVSCADDVSVCMTEENKKHFSQIGIWAEGVEGEFHLEIRNIRAENLAQDPASQPLFASCRTSNQRKYFILDTEKHTCSETCLLPRTFWVFKLFIERGLIVSNNGENACSSLYYTKFEHSTSRRVLGPVVKLQLDVYTYEKPLEPPVVEDLAVNIVTFDGVDPLTTWKFRELNDPVMGGQSTGSFVIINEVAIFAGVCAIVPSLQAPGFCKAESTDILLFGRKGIDVSGKSHAVMDVRSSIPYDGFKIAFTADAISSFFSFKANVAIPVSEEFITVAIPFSDFSNKWSPSTGEATVTCSEDISVCMSEKNKKDFSQVGIWAEGHEGEFKLEIKNIRAENYKPQDVPSTASTTTPTATTPTPTTTTRHCSVQDNLLYDMDKFTSIERMFPVEGDVSDESLGNAICCDDRFNIFAEPQFLYDTPGADLTNKIGTIEKPTIFYDSACGVAVFQAPVGRSRDDFLKDTEEHGWPSFRSEEVIQENVMILDDNRVVSSCGTMLGTYLPDDEGVRYCIDLVCVSGNPLPASTTLQQKM